MADDYLYDMTIDPYQLCNVVTNPDYQAIKQILRKELLDWIEKAEGKRPMIMD